MALRPGHQRESLKKQIAALSLKCLAGVKESHVISRPLFFSVSHVRHLQVLRRVTASQLSVLGPAPRRFSIALQAQERAMRWANVMLKAFQPG